MNIVIVWDDVRCGVFSFLHSNNNKLNHRYKNTYTTCNTFFAENNVEEKCECDRIVQE